MSQPLEPRPPQPALSPPVAQALGRIQAARELLAQVAAPGPLLRKLEYTSRADRELAAAVNILRSNATYRID